MASLAQKSSILNNMETLVLGGTYIGSYYMFLRPYQQTNHRQLAMVGISRHRSSLPYFGRNRYPHSL
jgi:hypothetical protein